jgi:hypothetical protein
MRISRKLVLLIPFACLIFIVGVWLNKIWTCHRHIVYSQGHRRALMLNRLRTLALGIQLVVLDTNSMPPKGMKSLSKYVKSHLNTFGDESDMSKWFDPNTGEIIDYWATPVDLVTKMPEEYTFISFGPNRKNENGKGDDIIYTFDPFELKKNMKRTIHSMSMLIKT